MKIRALSVILYPLFLFSNSGVITNATAGLPEEGVKFASPDGRFALRIGKAQDSESGDLKVDVIEKASGKVMVDLATAYSAHLPDTVLVWSADSKWVAYGTRDNRTGETNVYFWNGTTFDSIALPAELPSPNIKYRKGDDAAVKNYGGAVKPARWLKSGQLELASEETMMSRESDLTYTGVVLITISFDARHHASITNVSKTKTKVE